MMMASPGRRDTGGVDTYHDVHVAAVCDSATAAMLATASFPTTPAGYACLLAWMNDHGASTGSGSNRPAAGEPGSPDTSRRQGWR